MQVWAGLILGTNENEMRRGFFFFLFKYEAMNGKEIAIDTADTVGNTYKIQII